MKYLAIDTETTGLDTERHQVLEIGSIVEDTKNLLDYENIPKLNLILHYDEFVGTSFALALNARIFEILKDYEIAKRKKNSSKAIMELENSVGSKIIPYNEAWSYLYDFLNRHLVDDQILAKVEGAHRVDPIHITAAGKNVAGFDLPKLRRLPRFNEYFRFKSRVIDPGNYWVHPDDLEMPGLDLCLERAGIDRTVSHVAVEDSWDVIQTLRKGAKNRLYI